MSDLEISGINAGAGVSAGAGSGLFLSATYSARRSHSEIFYVGHEGYICYRFVRKGIWDADAISFR